MNSREVGRIVWYELLTSDPKAAIAFYTEVVAWQTMAGDTPDYTMFAAQQGPLGGVWQLPDMAKQQGARPYWQANIQVENRDASVAQVKQLGGKVYHTEEAPGIGRFAVIADPQGAVVALFEPARDMASHDATKPGEFSWHELYTTDNQAAFDFYRQLVGWDKLGEFDMGPMGKYLLWGRGGVQLGGMMTMPPDMTAPDGSKLPPGWTYYITMEDFDAAFERAKAKGARVLNGPMPVPGGQRIVQLLDPQGAAFALVTPRAP
jgi:predicted enzyme related to lactoylglutathione lyase